MITESETSTDKEPIYTKWSKHSNGNFDGRKSEISLSCDLFMFSLLEEDKYIPTTKS